MQGSAWILIAVVGVCILVAAVGALVGLVAITRIRALETRMAAAESRGDRHRAELDALKMQSARRDAMESQRARENGALQ